jgi:uncharacterized peroxidase-related enzyme
VARAAPAPDDALAEFDALFEDVRARMGFVPGSMRIMARRPELLRAFSALGRAVLGPGSDLDPALAQLVAHVASAAAGCRYCQAHTGHMAVRRGAPPEKVAALWSDRGGDLFTPAERAALDLARAAAEVPGRAGPEHFAAARAHFTEAQILDIVGVVAFFGFLNRWNDAMATPLEAEPAAFAEATLAPHGWRAGKHAEG